MTTAECPIWINEEPFIQQLLAKLLDSAETGKIPRVRLRPGGWAQPLFEHLDDSGTRMFNRIQWLVDEPLSVLWVEYPSAGSGLRQETVYDGAWVYMKLEKTSQVRQWLGRTLVDEERMALQDALFVEAGKFADRGRALAQANLKVPGRTAQEVVEAFASIRDAVASAYTLRELSASCFWGDSKFLDDKQELLARLYPDCLNELRERPLFMQVQLPAQFEGILIIENQDTFMRACLGQLPDAQSLAVVFGSGFKAASAAVRQRNKLQFFYSQTADAYAVERFEQAWFEGDASVPVYFFGDFDWSGMGILMSLRQQFPALTAWRPGYERLRRYVENGGGHLPQQARKAQQLFVASTGCAYADRVLLPTLTRHSRFADQELQPDAD